MVLGPPALLYGTTLLPGHAILSRSGGWIGASPDPLAAPSLASSKDGHMIQRTLPDHGSFERWGYDPSPANHSCSKTSQSYF